MNSSHLKILVSGSSGLVGSALVPFLKSSGHQVITLVRKPGGKDTIFWDPKQGGPPANELEGFDAVIHLAGKNIATRWNDKTKQEILSSRSENTLRLSNALVKLQKPPKVFICASAFGFYGDRKDEILTEKSPSGAGFLAAVCREWEAATAPLANRGVRCINARFGVILSQNGGALAKMILPFRLGLGAVIGSGEQYMSWIALDDVIDALYHCLLKSDLEGPVNFTAPNPETNRTFSQKLAKALHRPLFFRIGEGEVRWLLGEMADEMLLSSAKVLPERLLQSGYHFLYPNLDQYLKRLFA